MGGKQEGLSEIIMYYGFVFNISIARNFVFCFYDYLTCRLMFVVP